MDSPAQLTIKGQPHSNGGGTSRRGFMKAALAIAAVLGLPEEFAWAFTSSLAKVPKLPVIWLEMQSCTGDTESLTRAGERSDPSMSGVTDPGIIDLLLDCISLEYNDAVIAPSGVQAEKSRDDVVSKYKGQYLCVIEGSIPTGAGGAYCCVGGKTGMSIAQTCLTNAKATMAVGSCAVSGGLPAAAPNPTGAKSVLEAFPSLANHINLPGCPANVVNIVASIAYFITYGAWPALDSSKRPTFAYGVTVHNRCIRRKNSEEGPYVSNWGDANARSTGCLLKMGCRGYRTYNNCATVLWNGACWPVNSGHGCIGCSQPKFWDTMFPMYSEPWSA